MNEEPEEQTLRALVTERLSAAAEEICELVERTIAEYEEELCRSKEENQRRQQLLEENQRTRHQRGAENPPEAARPVVKQEDDLQVHEVEVKEEENVYESSTDTSDVKEVQARTVPLRDDPADDARREFSVFPKSKTLVCSFCKLKFARPCQLKKHMVVHGCSFCQKICPSEKNLKLHMMLHTGEQPFHCPACDKRFRSRGFLNNHVKMKHSPVRPFSCSVCGAGFMSNHLLRQHMYQHTGRRAFACSLCQETFKRKSDVTFPA
uniref:C2H2-type domain-containing protein n=1 Tax=Neogobius melanostomus TaxID=47308 RepID=A0A8C6SCW8_9GOBI